MTPHTPYAPPRRRIWPALIGLVAGLTIAGLAIAGYALLGRHDVGTAAPASQPSAPVASSTSPAFSYGSSQAACQAIDRLVKAGTLDNMDQIRAWADAAADSPDTNVALTARILRVSADLATAAHGQNDEAKYTERARGDAVDLQKACIKAGYA